MGRKSGANWHGLDVGMPEDTSGTGEADDLNQVHGSTKERDVMLQLPDGQIWEPAALPK
jgi:hypothetical protein